MLAVHFHYYFIVHLLFTDDSGGGKHMHVEMSNDAYWWPQDETMVTLLLFWNLYSFIDLFLLFYIMLNKMLNMLNNNEPNRQDTDQPHNLGCWIMGCVCAMCRGVSELVWSGEKFEIVFQVMLTFLVKWPTYSTILTHIIIGQHIHTCRILWNDGAGEKAGSRLKHDVSFVWHVRYNQARMARVCQRKSHRPSGLHSPLNIFTCH